MPGLHASGTVLTGASLAGHLLADNIICAIKAAGFILLDCNSCKVTFVLGCLGGCTFVYVQSVTFQLLKVFS